MTDEARKALADKCELWPNANLQPEENRAVIAALRSQPGTLAREEVAECIAQWLHDETAHPEAYPNHTWPETERDDGQREGGFVKIVPLHGQEYFRDIARRLVRQFGLALTPSHEAEEIKRLQADARANGATIQRLSKRAIEAEQHLRTIIDAVHRAAPKAGTQEPVAWTNEAQLGFLKDPAYADIPMAMWGKPWKSGNVALYAAPQPASVASHDATRDGETIQALLDLLNPLHGELDRQTYYERLHSNFDAPRDAEYSVNITVQMERDLTQAVLILEQRKRAASPVRADREGDGVAQTSRELAETQAHLALRNTDIGIVLSALRFLEEATGEKFDDEGGDVAAIERDYNKASSLPSTLCATPEGE